MFLQAFLPLRMPLFVIFDLPLLMVTSFLRVARRKPVAGMLTGALIGLVQDSLTHQPIGTVWNCEDGGGYGASSLGVKLDVENAGTRLLVTIVFFACPPSGLFLGGARIGGPEPALEFGRTSWHRCGQCFLGGALFLLMDQLEAESLNRVARSLAAALLLARENACVVTFRHLPQPLRLASPGVTIKLTAFENRQRPGLMTMFWAAMKNSRTTRLTAVQYIILGIFLSWRMGLWRLQVSQSDYVRHAAPKRIAFGMCPSSRRAENF